MAEKAARGTKRQCLSCGSKFYDLNRDPIICPICGATFHTEQTSAPAPASEPAPAIENDNMVVEETVDVTDDGPEFVPLEEAESDDAVDDTDPDEEAIAEIEDTEDIPDADDEDTFLEDDEDGDDDMSDIIRKPSSEEGES